MNIEVPAKFRGKEAFYEKMMRMFVRDMPVWADFDDAIKNIEELKITVHKIKGTAGNLDLMEVHQCALHFETSLRNNEPDRDLYQMLVDVCEYTKRRVSEEPGNPMESVETT